MLFFFEPLGEIFHGLSGHEVGTGEGGGREGCDFSAPGCDFSRSLVLEIFPWAQQTAERINKQKRLGMPGGMDGGWRREGGRNKTLET